MLGYHKKHGTSSPLYQKIRAKYPNWENPGWIADAVERFYAEAN